MADDIPFVECGFNKAKEKFCIINDKEYMFLRDILFEESFLHLPENISVLAEVLNHFEMGNTFELIEDIDSFNDEFRQKYAAEEDQPWDQFNPSVSDFEMPDLSQIKPPEMHDGIITFYTRHRGLGIPYKVSGNADGREKLTYAPL